MNRRVLFLVMLACCFSVTLAQAQDTPAEGVLLRLVHGGDFLPRGTAIVVLVDQGEIEPDASLLPRFLAPDAYAVTLVDLSLERRVVDVLAGAPAV